jgi:putative NADH-flavin reductase
MVVSTGTQHIVEAMAQQGIRRLIVVTSLGVGDSKDQTPFFFKILARTLLRKAMQDKERQEEIVKASGLEWTIVRPGGLTDGPKTGAYTYGLDPRLKARQLSRADLAEFVLKQASDNQFVGKTPAIT